VALSSRVLGGYVFNRRPARLFEWRFARRRLVGPVRCCRCWEHSSSIRLVCSPWMWSHVRWSVDRRHYIYAFLARLLAAGFAMALLLHLAKPNMADLIIVLFGCRSTWIAL